MHLRQLNHARLGIVLKPRGPLLIKSGIETPDPTRPGMEFVRTRHPEHGETVYLPGSSLKGAMRSHAERVLQGLSITVCDPFARKGRCRSASGPSPRVFQAQCPACRTFGSLKLSGRFRVLDAYPWPLEADASVRAEAVRVANATESRWQVGINRRTGQAQGGALYDLEVVVGGEFHTEIHLHNFQLWQLGLTAAIVREMDEGHVPIGFGKFRGLGQVEARLTGLRATMTGRTEHLLGVGELCGAAVRSAYDLDADDAVDLPDAARPRPTWRGSQLAIDGKDLDDVLDRVIDGPLASFVRNRSRRRAAGSGR
jgi:CRISPR/Cas system CSM-associated protein Csm3 (group 7 of RAMP superfamily)